MNTLIGTLHHPERVASNDPVAMLKKRLAGMFGLIVTWHQRAEQRRQLLDLDAHLLEDVGISRTDALELGQRPFWRD